MPVCKSVKPLVLMLMLGIAVSTTTRSAQAYPGLPTRSQNPLLQSYLIPAVPLESNQGWAFAHNLYITNTYQTDTSSNEKLIIDVENTRYDFQAAYRDQQWTWGMTLSLISNRAGWLDQTIEGWHNLFGLPQGGRDQVANDQLNLLYQKDGVDIINTQQASSGLADIQLSASYALSPTQTLWATLELPSSVNEELLSNQQADFAAGYSASHQLNEQLSSYGSIGLSLLSDSGIFENRINPQLVFAQFGFLYRYSDQYHLLLQTDFHSSIVKNSNLDALSHSLQAQFGLRLPRLLNNHQIDIFFSEDIQPGFAPDITFALRVSPLVF